MSRPKIKGIFVEVEYPNGKNQTITVSPDCWGVFFDADFGKTTLGAFYTANPGKKMLYTDLVKAFGKKIANEILASSGVAATSSSTKVTTTTIPITAGVIDQIWNGVDEYGMGVAFVVKTPPCFVI